MDGDWPLKETNPSRTLDEEVRASKDPDNSWTLVEYRPGRYAKVTPDGAVIGRASEAEARAWFRVQSTATPRSASSAQDAAPAQKPKRATEGGGLQAWFAAQREEQQSTQSPSSAAPSESAAEETGKPGIRDWLAAQKRDTQPGTAAGPSDPPAVSTVRVPGELQPPTGILEGDEDAGAEQPVAGLSGRAPAEAEPLGAALVEGIDSDSVLQDVLLTSEASDGGPEADQPEPAPAAVPKTDLRQPEPSAQESRELGAESAVAAEAGHDSLAPEAIQLAFTPALGEKDTDADHEGRVAPVQDLEPVLAEPPAAKKAETAILVEPLPALGEELVLTEPLPTRKEPLPEEPPPPGPKAPARDSRAREHPVAPTSKPDSPGPPRQAVAPKDDTPTPMEEAEAKTQVADPEIELPAPESVSSDPEEWVADEDLGPDGDMDWLDPGTPPPDATAQDRAPASAPTMPVGAKAGTLHVRTAQDVDGTPPEPIAPDGYDRWLWVDPRQERGYDVGAFDLAAFLGRAVDLFQSKRWTGGRKPARLAAHPDEVANGLKAMADSLGLEMVSDPRVTPGTYRLGLATDNED